MPDARNRFGHAFGKRIKGVRHYASEVDPWLAAAGSYGAAGARNWRVRYACAALPPHRNEQCPSCIPSYATRSARDPARRAAVSAVSLASAQDTAKPVLHGRHWAAITGKPLAASAGAMMFARGGNAIDAACAMLGATSTMWDTLGWGGETQALIYNPETEEGHRHQRPRRGADRGHAGVLPRTGHGLSAGVRPPGRGHAGHARRPDGDARRVRPPEPRRGAGAVHRDGRGLPDRSLAGRQHRAPPRRHRTVAGLHPRVPAASRSGETRAARRTRRGETVPPAGPRSPRCRSWSTPKPRPSPPASRARRPSTPPTSASTAATSPRRSCAPAARHGGLFTSDDLANWEVHLEEPVSTNYAASTSTS
jgi:hypothetical protein